MTAAVFRRAAVASPSGSAAFGRRYWGLVGKLALLGPLIGGAPYNIFVIPIPISYVLGIVPATFSAIAYVYWLQWPTPRQPGPVHRAAIGAVLGALGCAATAVLAGQIEGFRNFDIAPLMLWCLPHGVLAGAVLGAWSRRLASDGDGTASQAANVPPLSTPWRVGASN